MSMEIFVILKLWQEKDSSYTTDKKDPGGKFMRLVRNGLKLP